MPSIQIWGPSTWTILHTMAEKINENDFARLLPQFFGFIRRICAFLPCPECSQHATRFLAKLKKEDISTKTDFKNMLYCFHNVVNAKKHKPLYNHINMEKYKSIPLQVAFNNFVSVYNTRGNMRLLAETFQRKLVVRDLKSWLLTNVNSFSLP
jgi:hypothetical protein